MQAGSNGIGVGIDVKVSAGAGPVSAEGTLNIPIVQESSLVNPLKKATLEGAGNLTGGNENTSITGSSNGERSSISGQYGEGIIFGGEISAPNDSVGEFFGAIGNAVTSDISNLVGDVRQRIGQVTGGTGSPQDQ
jgi:hypothetical protein